MAISYSSSTPTNGSRNWGSYNYDPWGDTIHAISGSPGGGASPGGVPGNHSTGSGIGYNAPAAPTSTGGMFGATPTRGQGAYGLVPGQIEVPGQIQSNINNDLSGLVSPEIMSRLQNQAARFGVSSGMPGSGLQWNSYLHDYLGAGQVAQQRGFENYKSLLPLAERNAELAAAPDPQQRAETEQSFAQQMFDKYLSALRSPAGATGNYRSPVNNGGNDAFRSPAAGTLPQRSGPTRTGGIDAVANPYSPRPTNTQVFPGSDDFELYPDMWQGLLGDVGGDPSMGTAPPGTWYDTATDTSNAPADFGDWNDSYWNDIFGMG